MQQPHAHLSRPVHKEPPAHAPNAALLIDFDNVTMGIRSDLQTELRRLLQSEIIRGKVAVQRAYADWRRYPQYIVPLSESSIDLIFAPAYGSNKKNATDIRLAIDALELVFTRPEIGTFILLSGDSDFSSLVLKLKEYGKYVIGVGIRESSSDLLIQNCDEYYSYNELAGFQKESDIVHERWDVWKLVVEAVKQMTAHNDVMRSDRLKQVMQEIDPAFDEKDAGFSRFTKFVQEAAHRGLIHVTRRENGQFEIALGGAASQAPAASPGAAPEPEAPTERRSSFVGDAFGLLKQALGQSRDEEPVDTPAPEEAAPKALTAKAHTAPPSDETSSHPPAAAARSYHEEEDEPPMPQSSAPPPPYSTPVAGHIPARSARFRRGSKGGPRPINTPVAGTPRVGPVETPAASGNSESNTGSERRERPERGDRPRGGRGRGARGGSRSEHAEGSAERPERGERGERGGRSRRGGRGRGRGGSGGTGEGNRERFAAESPRAEGAPSAPSAPAPHSPPPAPKKAPEPDTSGESFWTRVKRGLTGGGNA
ncbi:MAG TPA: NYN domain-containing protein [Gemmatimonadales bacterium]|nr:NYN domain-containing protein [Gemmatimonadales bacterium]